MATALSNQTSVDKDGRELEAVELRDERVVPFDFEDVMDAVWRAWVRWHIGGVSCMSGVNSAYCQHPRVDRPEDTFAVTFRLKCPSEGGESEFLNETMAVRRYVEAGRLVLVWRGTSESERKGLAGVLMDQTGWISVERGPCRTSEGRCEQCPSDPASRCTCGHTFIRSYVRILPRRVDQDSPSSSDAKASGRDGAALFVSFVAEMYRQDVSSIEREMETLLIRGLDQGVNR